MRPPPPSSTLFPYTTLFRSYPIREELGEIDYPNVFVQPLPSVLQAMNDTENRSEEHTSELQSRGHLVCRLLLEKKKRLDLADAQRSVACSNDHDTLDVTRKL